jgi:uncharacterized protein (TIGR03435 family)
MRRWGLLIATTVTVLAQTAARPSFDVISIKRTPKERLNQLKFQKCSNGGAFVEEGTPPLWVLEFAYQLDDNDVANIPTWMTAFDEAFDITAKADHPVSAEECRLMTQSLLAERFHLQVHRETRERAVFLLTVAAGGAKLQQVQADSPNEPGVRFNGRHPAILAENTPPPGWPISRLAYYIEGQLDDHRQVVDRTNLKGLYSFNLDYSRDGVERPLLPQALQQQLGLKLEPGRAPTEVLVIDRVERPSEN